MIQIWGDFMNDNITSGIVLRQILLNQREILNGLSKLLAWRCNGSANDTNGETRCNVALINRYHETEQILGLDWGEDVGFQGKCK